MKPRRVIVTLEIETDLSCKFLRDKDVWRDAVKLYTTTGHIIQVQANVVKPEKGI